MTTFDGKNTEWRDSEGEVCQNLSIIGGEKVRCRVIYRFGRWERHIEIWNPASLSWSLVYEDMGSNFDVKELVDRAKFILGESPNIPDMSVWKDITWNAESLVKVDNEHVFRFLISSYDDSSTYEGSIQMWQGRGWREIRWIPTSFMLGTYASASDADFESKEPFKSDSLQMLATLNKCIKSIEKDGYSRARDVLLVYEYAHPLLCWIYRIGSYRCHLIKGTYESYGEVSIWKAPGGFQEILQVPIAASDKPDEIRDKLLKAATDVLFDESS